MQQALPVWLRLRGGPLGRPALTQHTLRRHSTLACSTGVRPLGGGAGSPSSWSSKFCTASSQIGLGMSATSRTLAGSPRAALSALESRPSTPAHARASSSPLIPLSSSLVGSTIGNGRSFV